MTLPVPILLLLSFFVAATASLDSSIDPRVLLAENTALRDDLSALKDEVAALKKRLAGCGEEGVLPLRHGGGAHGGRSGDSVAVSVGRREGEGKGGGGGTTSSGSADFWWHVGRGEALASALVSSMAEFPPTDRGDGSREWGQWQAM